VKTEYRGPSRVGEVRSGPVVVRLARPSEPDRLLDDPHVATLNRRDDYMPYWAYLWPGSHLLAAVLSRGAWSGERALEIGCGLGLAGLVGVARGLRVDFTDYDSAPLDYVAESCRANGFDPGSYSVGAFDWREPQDRTYPVILGADILYEARLVPLVARLLGRMLATGGEALIADPYRVAASGFRGAVEELGLVCRVEAVEAESVELGAIRGTLHRVSRPS